MYTLYKTDINLCVHVLLKIFRMICFLLFSKAGASSYLQLCAIDNTDNAPHTTYSSQIPSGIARQPPIATIISNYNSPPSRLLKWSLAPTTDVLFMQYPYKFDLPLSLAPLIGSSVIPCGELLPITLTPDSVFLAGVQICHPPAAMEAGFHIKRRPADSHGLHTPAATRTPLA